MATRTSQGYGGLRGARGDGGRGGRGRGGFGGGKGNSGSVMKHCGGRGSRGCKGGMKSVGKVVVEPHRHEGVFIAKGNALRTKNMVFGESVYVKKKISGSP